MSKSEEETISKKRKLARCHNYDRRTRGEIHSIDSASNNGMESYTVRFIGIRNLLESVDNLSLPSDDSSVLRGKVL